MEKNQPDSGEKAQKKFNKVNWNILLGSLFLLSGIFSNAHLTQHIVNTPLIFLMLLSVVSIMGIAVCAFIPVFTLLQNIRKKDTTGRNVYKNSFVQGLLIIFWLTLTAATILLPNFLGTFDKSESWDGIFFIFEWGFLAIISLPLIIISFIAEILALLKKRREASTAKESENSAGYKLHPIMYISLILKIVFIIILIPFIFLFLLRTVIW